MALADIVNITITNETRTPTQEGFGTPLIATYHTRWVDRVRSYTGLAGMLTDGFVAGDPAYKIASVCFSQNTRPMKIKIGRRAIAPSQSVVLTVTSATVGLIYVITVNGTALSYTVPGAATTTTIATALAALIDALSGAVAASAVAVITVTPQVATTLVSFEAWNTELTVLDNTNDPGITTDLDAIASADNDWYGLLLDSNSKNEALAAAAWTEARGKLCVVQSGDTVALASGGTDVLNSLKTSAYARTAGILHLSICAQWIAAGLMSQRFTAQPGSDTWAFKTVAAVATCRELSSTERANVLAKNATVYEVDAGIAVTYEGKVGAGEWIDVVRGLDWLRARIRERIFGKLVASPKVSYTQAGIDAFGDELLGALRVAASVGLLTDDSLSVVAPKIKDVSAADKGARRLNNLQWSAKLAGAIHGLDVGGTVSV